MIALRLHGSGNEQTLGLVKSKIAETWRSVFNLRVMAIVVCAMVFAVLAGPFGTHAEFTTLERTLLWVPIIALSVVLGWLSNVTAQVVLAGRHLFIIEAFAVLLMTSVFAPCVLAYIYAFSPLVFEANGGGARLAFYVLVVASGVGVVRCAVLAWRDESVMESMPAPPPEPRLMQRLEPQMQGPVLRLSAKDHQVEVVTQAGVSVLRLRLGDAVAEMEPVEGFMTHRSHWVTKAAVVEAQRRDPGKVYLKLTNGDLVPVSRTFRPDWIDAGFLERGSDAAASGAESGTSNEATLGAASGPREGQAPSEPRLPPRA